MYGARRLRRGVAANAAGEGELLEKALHPLLILTFIGVNLRVRPLQVPLREDGWGPVPGTGDEDRVQVILIDQAVEMDVGKALSGSGTPVAQQSLLGVFPAEAPSGAGSCLRYSIPKQR